MAPNKATARAKGAKGAEVEAPKNVEVQVVAGGAAGGTVGARPVTAAETVAKARDEKFLLDLVAQMKNERKLEGDALVNFVKEESQIFLQTGNELKGATEKSAQRWARWAAQIPMTVKADGSLNVMAFLDKIWSMLDPSVKIEMEDKPGQFYKWSSVEKWGNSAAKTLGAMRLYITKNAAKLYPELVKAKVELTEDEKEIIAFDRAIEKVLSITTLPPTKFVAVDENGNVLKGATPASLAEMLRAFHAEYIHPHLPTKTAAQGEMDKAKAVASEVENLSAEELEALLAKKREASKATGTEAGTKTAAA